MAITAAAAESKVSLWLGSRRFAPRGLRGNSMLGNLAPLYTPAWIFTMYVTARYTGERGDDYQEEESYIAQESYTDGNGRMTQRDVTKYRTVTKTRWTAARGTVERQFAEIIEFSGDDGLSRKGHGLGPWDTEQARPFADDYLRGTTATSYNVNLPAAFPRAAKQTESEIHSLICRDIGGDHQRVEFTDPHYTDVGFKYVMLPGYLSEYSFRDKSYAVAVNGRSGSVDGERPYSKAKIAVSVLAVLVVLAIIVVLIVRSVSSSGGTNASSARVTPTEISPSDLEAEFKRQFTDMAVVRCPPGPALRAGDSTVCTVTRSDGLEVAVRADVGNGPKGLTVSADVAHQSVTTRAALPVTSSTVPSPSGPNAGQSNFLNYAYPASICFGFDPSASVTIRDGRGSLMGAVPVSVDVRVADEGAIAGMPGTKTVVIASCNAGVEPSATTAIVFDESDPERQLAMIRKPDVLGAYRSEIGDVQIDNGELVVTVVAFGTDRNGVGAQHNETIRYRWDGAVFQPTPPSTTAGRPAPSYATTHVVTIRTGPGTASTSLGEIPAGVMLPVTCTKVGETITDIWGPTDKWDYVTYNGVTGFVTDEWMNTKDDIKDRSKVPFCP